MLAVMKAGGASVAMDSSLPEERLRSIVDQVTPILVLASVGNQELVSRLTLRPIVIVDAALLEHLIVLGKPKLLDVQPWQRLYIVFTSGSTGTPKGVINTHSNYSSSLRYQQTAYGFTADSRVYDFASYAFDVSWINLLSALECGACLCIPSEADRRNDLGGSISRFQATHVVLTPSVAQTLSPVVLKSLSTLIIGGERLPTKYATEWARIVNLKNSYGPCECTPTATIASIKPDDINSATIGKGMGLNTWVINSVTGNSLTPIGGIGELFLEGPLVGAGYLGDPQKTVTAFTENPSWLLRGAPGQLGRHGRLYKTGDLVRYNSDGSLTVVGRKDAQVKINGQRVELSDIEYHVRTSLAWSIGVQVMAEMVTPQDSEKAMLVAFLQITQDTSENENDIQDSVKRLILGLDDILATKLPAYMIPSAYIALNSLPMTASGKTDRRALRALGERLTLEELTMLNGPAASERVPPTTAMERKLQDLWSTVLGIKADRIGANDSFLRIGGDSIGAMRLVGVARERGLYLTVANVFNQPRLKDMARVVSEISDKHQILQPFVLLKTDLDLQAARSYIAEFCDVDAIQIQDIFPCTPLQEGLLALSAKRPGDYIAQYIFELQSTIDVDLFRRAWEEVQRTTPILRTRIIDLTGQGLVQVIIDQLTRWPSNDSLKNLNTFTQADKQVNMNLGSPLVRVAIVEEYDGNQHKRFFVLTIHHALYDGWSLPIMIERLSLVYQKVAVSYPPQFQDFVRYIIDIDQDLAAKFWEAQFEGSEAQVFPALPFPNYQPRSDNSVKHYIQNLKWPETDVTASTVVRTAWSILTAQHIDSQDVIFGVTVTGRQADVADVSQMVGPTIATVPVRVVLDREQTVGQLLLQVQAQAVEMTPFEQSGLQQIRRVSANAEQACAFQTLLVIQPTEADSAEQKRIFIENTCDEDKDTFALFDIQIINVESIIEKNGLRLLIKFDSNVIGSQQINRMAIQLENIIRIICDPENVDITLRDIDNLGQEDLMDIWTWNSIVPDIVEDVVHDLIAETTRRQPNAPAVAAWDGDWTYAELDDLATFMAYHLVGLGIGPDVIVPLCFEKSKWTPVAMLAVMKAGGASVVMDSTLPEERLRAIVHQVKPILILSSFENQELARQLTKRPTVVITVDDVSLEQLRTAGQGVRQQLPNVQPWNKAYVVFTSGSTGTPKGAMLTHSNVSSGIRYQRDKLGFHSSSRVFDFASYSFDVAWSDFTHILTVGGCLCIPSEFDRMNNLAGSLVSFNATHVDLTPTVGSTLRPSDMKSLERIVFSGEALSPQLASVWAEYLPTLDSYGPAECVRTTCVLLDRNSTASDTIGTGLGLCTWVVRSSEHNELVPIGTIGELLLEGPLVGAGYLGDPEKTAAAFIEDPKWLLRGAPGRLGRHGRLYKTGDLVRYNSDGSLAFIGRKDTQIKINGQRVELGDVEYHVRTNLAQDPVIQVVADVIRPHDNINKMLVAFIQINEPTSRGENTLQDKVKRLITGLNDRLLIQIPSHMIPTAYIAVESLLMTAAGKTDRRRLRRMGERLTQQELTMLNSPSSKRVPPTTLMERKLQEIWSTVLGVKIDHIGTNDSFLQIGGDSIGAMRLVGLVREQNLHLTVADVFKQPRLRDMARVVGELSEDDNQIIQPFSLLRAGLDLQVARSQIAKLCDLDAIQIEDIFPCTSLQEGLLALSSKRPGDYIAQFVFELQSTVHVDLFRRAWEEVQRTTPILRTRIVDLVGQGLVQVITDQLTCWSSNYDYIKCLNTYTETDKQLNMGLGSPLVRVAIVEDHENQHKRFFALTIHHALYDGSSLPILMQRLSQAYDGVELLYPPPFQGFVRHIMDIEQDRATKFWEIQFEDFKAEIFPSLPSATYQPKSDTSIIHYIQDLRWPEIDVTASTVVRTAWAILATQYTGSDDVIFGITSTGRQADIPGVDRMTGPTIATVPVRIQLNQEQTLEQLLLQVQAQAVDMMVFEQTGLQRISQISTGARQACGFQSLLVINPSLESNGHETDLFTNYDNDSSGNKEDSSPSSDFDTHCITIEFNLEHRGSELRIEFDSSVVDKKQVERLVTQLKNILRQMCDPKNTQTKLAKLQSVSEEDLKDIWSWNATVPETVDALVHDLVGETIRRQPDATAICAWDGTWTYIELDNMSTRLAYYLVGLGIDPGVIVPLCFEKSRWTPVAMLAVMKAGGASVAMDSSLPEERLRAIVDQVEPILILSSSKNKELAGRLTKWPTIIIDNVLLETLTTTRQLPDVKPCDTLYIVFTSGSTGKPKGVIITHSNFSSAIRHQESAHGFTSESRVYDFASYTFDVAWANLLCVLQCGACLCIPSDTDRRDDLEGSIRRFEITHVELTPSVAQTLSLATLRSLSSLIVGGERLLIEYATEWSAIVNLKNSYGPCECTPTATVATIETHNVNGTTIGRGIGLNTWVVNAATGDSLAPVGSIGELFLEGPLVGAGYLGDTAKTAEAFIEDPPWLLLGGPGKPGRHGRLYKTGDLVRYNSDGSLTVVGRKDAQVKINGQRVELGDIEYHISTNLLYITKTQVVVEVVRPRESHISMLVAFLLVSTDELITEDIKNHQGLLRRITTELDDRLVTDLPAHMIPSAYIFIKSLPMTVTGKTDRRHLRAMGERMTLEELTMLNTLSREQLPPTTPMEHKLQKLWATILGIKIDSIGANDSFLRIGGDSIGAMRLVGIMREQNLHVTVADIFKQPRLRDMAKIVGEISTHDDEQTIQPFSLLKTGLDVQTVGNHIAAGLCGVDIEHIEDMFPCTPLQEGLLALSAKRPGDYIAQFVFELQSTIDVDVFCKAWEELQRITPILRTRIVDLLGQGLVQVVLDELVQWPSKADVISLSRYTQADKQLNMNLGSPLVRVAIAEEPEDKSWEDKGKWEGKRFFIWTIHHALYDGWSMSLMIERLSQAYHGKTTLSYLRPFQGFIKHIINIDQSRARDFWETQFKELRTETFPSMPSPTYQPRSDTSIMHHFQNLEWPDTDVTASTVVRTAWAILVAQYTDSDDIVFGVTVTGRQADISGIDQMAGPTIATVLVRIVLDREETLDRLLLRVQAQAVEMTAFEQTGLQNIRRISANAEQACAFQSLLVIHLSNGDSDNKTEADLFTDYEYEEKNSFVTFDTHIFTIESRLETHGLQLRIGFDSNVIESHQVNRIAMQLENIIRIICNSEIIDVKLADVSSLCQEDLKDIWDWNQTVPEKVDVLVHDLITEIVTNQPNAPAVCAWDGTWTYAELGDMSTRLTYRLVGLGVGPGVIVPLCFEKSRWTPVAMLAVMKAGGASVAMDSSLSEERLRAIVDQVEPILILSSSKNQDLVRRLTQRPTIIIDNVLLETLITTGQGRLPDVKPWDTLYIVFTSGSTGTPKGVIITHSNFSSAIHHQQAGLGFKSSSRVYDFAMYSFDVTWSNFVHTLSAGGCLCIPSDFEARNDITVSFLSYNANFVDLTPSVASTLKPSNMRRLQRMLFSGESLTGYLATEWSENAPTINTYGPAECSVKATFAVIGQSTDSSTSIGKGVGLCTWIVRPSDHNVLVPLGVVGELLLEGPLVGAGYLGDLEKTTAAFIEDPAWLLRGSPGQPGRHGRLYKTGDLVRYSPDGNLTFLGRKDDQIKINGQRVELGEIEHYIRLELAKDLNVQVIADMVRPQDSDKAILVAFIQITDTTIEDENKLQNHVNSLATTLDDKLATKVPFYMIPLAYIVVKTLPMTATGKTDRRSIRAMGERMKLEELISLNGPGTKRLLPTTSMERKLQELWSIVLGFEANRIGVNDSFLRIGGDSIVAMRLVGAARERGLYLTVANVFKQPRLKDMAKVVAESTHDSE
jgi:amino acid adenylation domain-containing protein